MFVSSSIKLVNKNIPTSQKLFDKIQHPFMIKQNKTKKFLNILGIEGKYLNMIKVVYDKNPKLPSYTVVKS